MNRRTLSSSVHIFKNNISRFVIFFFPRFVIADIESMLRKQVLNGLQCYSSVRDFFVEADVLTEDLLYLTTVNFTSALEFGR